MVMKLHLRGFLLGSGCDGMVEAKQKLIKIDSEMFPRFLIINPVRISPIHHNDQKSAALYTPEWCVSDSLSKQILLLFSLFLSSFVLLYLVFRGQKRRDEGQTHLENIRAFVLHEPSDLLGFKLDVSLPASATSTPSFPLFTDRGYESENHAIPIFID